ncbi:MAG: hypothetical protein RBR23_01090 [Arcobacteraceae bacterium]|jgi:ABC-type uncharacterized transport system permease subunit|nr:hypothetical protein [Arcobacteraceae bacterium]
MKSKTLIITGLIMIISSFFLGSLHLTASKINLDISNSLTLFLLFTFIVIAAFLQFSYHTKHKDTVEKANKKIPNMF